MQLQLGADICHLRGHNWPFICDLVSTKQRRIAGNNKLINDFLILIRLLVRANFLGKLMFFIWVSFVIYATEYVDKKRSDTERGVTKLVYCWIPLLEVLKNSKFIVPRKILSDKKKTIKSSWDVTVDLAL